MDRRENLRWLISGSIATGFLFTAGCKSENNESSKTIAGYGRTPEELLHDAQIMREQFFSEKENKMIEILCDIIIPADEKSGSATEAGVPEFIEFMLKDYPPFQLPIRGGLMWLNNECHRRFNLEFLDCNAEQRMLVIEDIAWPDTAAPEMNQGVKFFNLMRNLTATGFFTSEIGIKDLGYAGNRPNEWDGVPDDVLKKHGLSYDQKTLAVCLKMEDRNKIPVWDDNGNLIG